MKKILILGGTKFVGRNLVEKLIKKNQYDITLFNRGKSNPDLFPEVKLIQGDRKTKEGVELFSLQEWDAIIDISGIWAKPFEEQMALHTGRVGRYIYVSTCSHCPIIILSTVYTEPMLNRSHLFAFVIIVFFINLKKYSMVCYFG